jgi:hypothetical protein
MRIEFLFLCSKKKLKKIMPILCRHLRIYIIKFSIKKDLNKSFNILLFFNNPDRVVSVFWIKYNFLFINNNNNNNNVIS